MFSTRWLFAVALLAAAALPPPACAAPSRPRSAKRPAEKNVKVLRRSARKPAHACTGCQSTAPPAISPYRGWGYLVEKLRRDGIDEQTLRSIYDSPRMPYFTRVAFALDPRESHQQYRLFMHPSRISEARACLRKHAASFSSAERYFGVDKNVLAAITLVETHCGRVLGSAPIIERLSRVAIVREPDNLQFNYARLRESDPQVAFAQVAARAAYLEETFYPEVLALIRIAAATGSSVYDFKGSYAGAFGMPQFLPSAYVKFGIDADGDGRISLFSPPDAIASVANFLSSYGWRDEDTDSSKKQVIWMYNHSEAYVDTVLNVATALGSAREEPAARRRKA